MDMNYSGGILEGGGMQDGVEWRGWNEKTNSIINKYIFKNLKIKFLKSKKKYKIIVGEDIEKLEPLCTVDENVAWYSQYGKNSMVICQKVKELPPSSAIPNLGTYPKELNSRSQ